MRIGLFLERAPWTAGGFNQALSMVVALARPGATVHEIVVFTQYQETLPVLSSHGIAAVLFNNGLVRFIDKWAGSALGRGVLKRAHRLGFRRLGRHLDAFLDDYGIDLVVFSEFGDAALRLGEHGFIVTVWDLFHRDHPEFPIGGFRNHEHYERAYWSVLSRAYAVIVDSSFLARRLECLYHLDRERIVLLPFVPALAVRQHTEGKGSTTAEEVVQKYGLKKPYIFYPAYFTPHKNHLYLLEGLIDLERRHGIVMHAVFCGGGDKGDQPAVERQVRQLGLNDRVHFIGLVPDAEIPALYNGALALVMPGYAGPTNLPPLEAVALDCPVIYSDLPEFREQMGDAALYCNLNDVSNLADHVASLIREPQVGDRLRTAGRRFAAEMARTDYAAILEPVFDRYAYTRRRWAWPEAKN